MKDAIMPFHFRFVLLLTATTCAGVIASFAANPLLDWSDWEKYRSSVRHPSGAIKPDDLARARENLRRYDWAVSYLENLERNSRAALEKLSSEYLVAMIPETTP